MSTKVNIKDIALKTGLSITTVSRVLNGKAKQYRIGKKSQQIIKEVAKELNYIPNHFAANLRSGKSNTLGLILPSLDNPFFARIAGLINIEIRKHGYALIISDSNEDAEAEKLELQQFVSRNIEGLIIVPCGSEIEHIEQINNQKIPLILIDRYFENSEIPYVATDNFYGAVMATQHLIQHGHSSIACIQGVKGSTPNRLRVNGFKKTMQEAGNKNIRIVGDDFSVQNGFLETKLLLQWKDRPTAIFTLSNTIAMGCLQALKEENIRVPKDISLITFDDHPYLDFLATPITSIAQPIEHICKIALRYLFSRIEENGESMTNQVILKPELKIRESVKRIAKT
jgi:LacI family transcriptional regulator, galactose operon repressor